MVEQKALVFVFQNGELGMDILLEVLNQFVEKEKGNSVIRKSKKRNGSESTGLEFPSGENEGDGVKAKKDPKGNFKYVVLKSKHSEGRVDLDHEAFPHKNAGNEFETFYQQMSVFFVLEEEFGKRD